MATIPGGFNIWYGANKAGQGWSAANNEDAWAKYGSRYEGIGADRKAGYEAKYTAANPQTPIAAPSTPPVGDPALQKKYNALNAKYNSLIKTQNAPETVTSTLSGKAAEKRLYPTDVTDTSRYSADPVYQYQKQQGEKALNARLAKQGLFGSSSEIGQYNDLTAKLLADQAQRYDELAQKEADRFASVGSGIDTRAMANATANADRAADLSKYEATRALTSDQNNWSRLTDLLDLGYKYSPYSDLMGMVNNQASLFGSLGGGGGGGRSGGGSPASLGVPQQPYPINAGSVYNNYQNNNDLINFAGNLLPILGGFFG